ncbi:MAG: HAD family hydrolase [Gammaproteobacteria bacterium]
MHNTNHSNHHDHSEHANHSGTKALRVKIPGFHNLTLEHAVFDYNGTLAIEGILIEGVAPLLNALAKHLQVHVLTGDTFGKARQELAGIDCHVTIIPAENQGAAKASYMKQLHPSEVIAIGNGRNDRDMLNEAKVGIIVLGEEGAATESMMAADLVVPNIFSAFALLHDTRKLSATLRS